MKRPAALGAPGSVRHSLLLLGAVALAAEILLALLDGLAAAATGLVLLTAAGLGIARYVGGAGSQDSGHRQAVRLLGSRSPALGQWQHVVRRPQEGRDQVYLPSATLRPQVQRLYAARLAARHGVDAGRDPERARALVGPGLWPWIDPEADAPDPEIPETLLRALLDRLEAL